MFSPPQYVGWYSDESLGGVSATVSNMLKADPEFIMGHCLKLTLNLGGNLGIDNIAGLRSIRTDSTFEDDLRSLEEMASKNPNATKRELKHVDALIKYAHGDSKKAFEIWESILLGKSNDTTKSN